MTHEIAEQECARASLGAECRRSMAEIMGSQFPQASLVAKVSPESSILVCTQSLPIEIAKNRTNS
jgi:hypothetical protein